MAGALIPYGMQAGRALIPAAGRALSPIEKLLERLLGPGASARLGGPGGAVMENGIPGMSRAQQALPGPGGAVMEYGIPGMSRAVPGAQALPGGMSPGQLAGAGAAAAGTGAMIGMMPPDTAPQSDPLFDELTRRGAYDNSQWGAEGDGMGRVMQPNPYGDLSGVPMQGYGSEGAGVPVMQESPEVVLPQRAARRPEMLRRKDERNAPAAVAHPAPPKRPKNLPQPRVDYQSNNRAVSQGGVVNWADPDNAADFFRADQEMRRLRGLLG